MSQKNPLMDQDITLIKYYLLYFIKVLHQNIFFNLQGYVFIHVFLLPLLCFISKKYFKEKSFIF